MRSVEGIRYEPERAMSPARVRRRRISGYGAHPDHKRVVRLRDRGGCGGRTTPTLPGRHLRRWRSTELAPLCRPRGLGGWAPDTCSPPAPQPRSSPSLSWRCRRAARPCWRAWSWLHRCLQFALAAWAPLLRRIITPLVSGTVLMLVSATVVPVAIQRLKDVPDGLPAAAGPSMAAATLIVTVAMGLRLRKSGALRLWTPLLGIVSGCAAAGFFGLYDLQRFFDAPWVGIPAFCAARLRPARDRRILVAAAGLLRDDAGQHDSGHRRRHRGPAGVVADAARDRFSTGSGCGSRQRRGLVVVGRGGHHAHLHPHGEQRVAHQLHRRGVASCRLRHRRHSDRAGHAAPS